jgi:hypothetical protein
MKSYPTVMAADPGLLTSAETSLLTDQYELAMAASYFQRDMNESAVFELFTRRLPIRRHWLLTAGLGPALSLVQSMRFGGRELTARALTRTGERGLDHRLRRRSVGRCEGLNQVALTADEDSAEV